MTATFAESPQLPFSDFKLHFTNGPRAPLSNPPACGTYTPEASLSAWSGQTVQSNRPFEITQGESGAPCPGSVFAPSFTAGTSNNQAGAFSPFTLTFSRSDEDQTLGGIAVQMPPGLLGKIAGIPRCPEAQANAGTCGAESLVGHTTVGAGPGSDPFYVSGNVYLTEGYKGAPFGLSIVVPVVAGPFNLGTEVIRAAIAINPYTAQITVTSNPLPTIKEGIPFQVRTVNVTIERPNGQGFTFNPTNCTPSAIGATLTSTQGAQATVSSPFEAANCANLPFKPDFSASTSGKTSKALGASLTVKIGYTGRAGEHRQGGRRAAESAADPAEDAAEGVHRSAVQQQPGRLPAGVGCRAGHGAYPAAEQPADGPRVPGLATAARRSRMWRWCCRAKVSSWSWTARRRSRRASPIQHFETVPDAPISSFEFKSPQGELALFTAEGDLCDQKLVMPTQFTAQNGAEMRQSTKIAVTGCPKAHKKLRRRPSIRRNIARLRSNPSP